MAETEQKQLLDRGYDALRTGAWDQADSIFDRLLQAAPHNGLACLGRAMVEGRIHTREELAEHWEELGQNDGFRKTLEPSQPDFLLWLEKEMRAAGAEENSGTPPAFALSDLTWWIPYMSTGRKLLLGFAALQVILLLTMAAFIGLSQPEAEREPGYILGSLMMASIFAGSSVILGPVYGNSIVEAGRFCGLLKVLNLISGILGCAVCGFLTVVFYSTFQDGNLLSDRYSFYAYLTALIIHVLALVMPPILDKVEYG